MKTINIIGSGNVAFHLVRALKTLSDYSIKNIVVRSLNNDLDVFTQQLIVTTIEDLKPADITIIAVTDNAITQVSNKIPYENTLVAHTSGTSSLELLSDKNRKGVFYPLQTFSKSKEVNFKEIPLCLEAENSNDLKELKLLAEALSNNVYNISSDQRKSLHVAAVFVSNFTNHMYTIGNEICKDNNISFDILKPLIKETADKINFLHPIDAQTGPAKRYDEITIKAHEEFLKNKTYKTIYNLITQSIQENV